MKIHGAPELFDVEICVGSLVPLNGGVLIDEKEKERKKEKSRNKRLVLLSLLKLVPFHVFCFLKNFFLF